VATGDLLQLLLDYGTQDNGNLRSQTMRMPQTVNAGQWLTIPQTYTYDGVDRLSTVDEAATGLPAGTTAQNWSQMFHYDAFGNLWTNPPATMGRRCQCRRRRSMGRRTG
jgi:hypothetical protein